MIKPFTLRVQETEKKIVDVLNESGIPAFCLKQLLQGIYQQLDNIDQEEIKKYKESESEK